MKRTVFVLGAGASMGYEFPSGQGLVDRLCIDLAPNKYEEVNKLVDQELGIDATGIEKFRKALYYSEAVSVDLFLGKNQQFLTVGKRAIANALIKFEKEQALFNKERDIKDPDNHWYRRFFNQLIRSLT